MKRKSILAQCNDEHTFVLKNGQKLSSLFDLADSLESMESDVFAHHVNESRNDFSTWIKDIYQENGLADQVGQKRDKKEMQLDILKALVSQIKH